MPARSSRRCGRSSARCASDDRRWYLARAAALPHRRGPHRRRGADLHRHHERRAPKSAAPTRATAPGGREHQGLRDRHPRSRRAVTSWNTGAERIFGYARSRDARAAGRRAVRRRRTAPPACRRRKCGAPREEGRAEDERWHLRKDGSALLLQRHHDAAARGRRAARLRQDRARPDRQQAGGAAAREPAAPSMRPSARRPRRRTQLKDEFLAVMSHELKNPLNLIQLNAELLSRLPEARVAARGGARGRHHPHAPCSARRRSSTTCSTCRASTPASSTLERGPVDWPQRPARSSRRCRTKRRPSRWGWRCWEARRRSSCMPTGAHRADRLEPAQQRHQVHARGGPGARSGCHARGRCRTGRRGATPAGAWRRSSSPKVFDMFTQEQGGSARRHGRRAGHRAGAGAQPG